MVYNVDDIRDELKDYVKYKNKLNRCEERIDELFYNMVGVKSPSIDSPSAHSTQTIDSKKLILLEKKQALDDERRLLLIQTKRIEHYLELCTKHKDVIEEVYFNGKKIRQVAKERNYAISTIYKQLTTGIKSIIVRL